MPPRDNPAYMRIRHPAKKTILSILRERGNITTVELVDCLTNEGFKYSVTKIANLMREWSMTGLVNMKKVPIGNGGGNRRYVWSIGGVSI